VPALEAGDFAARHDEQLEVASNLIPPREEEIAEAPGWKPQRRRR
jgi:hypothetical protein